MPPAVRSQTASQEAIRADHALSTVNSSSPNNAHSVLGTDDKKRSSGMRMRQDASTQFESHQQHSSEKAADSSSTTSRQSNASSKRRRRAQQDEPDEPPRFVIDLSLPPEQRYVAVCRAYQSEIAELVPLFDEVVGGMLHAIPLKWLHRFCRLFLRGVYDNEEQGELRGISKATGVSIYLLVCFNVLLDLFMGCSSGGAAVGAGGKEDAESKMVHFRTLDWGMPSLRRVVVQLDFVLEKDGPVFASSITYAGYVGVLTGVRGGVSMSLNFRPNRIDNGKVWSDAKYIWHLACVLLGWRRSISSTIRGFLIPQQRRRQWIPFCRATEGSKDNLLDYAGIVAEMGGDIAKGQRPITTTACYFTVCDGTEATVIEKDRISARTRSGDEFIVVTNTDDSPPLSPLPAEAMHSEKPNAAAAAAESAATGKSAELAEIMTEAKDRQECAFHNWRNLQSARARKQGLQHISGDDRKRLASVEDVIQLTQKYPTTNECTHFAAVMDPSEARVLWCRRWLEPIGAQWVRNHMSSTW